MRSMTPSHPVSFAYERSLRLPSSNPRNALASCNSAAGDADGDDVEDASASVCSDGAGVWSVRKRRSTPGGRRQKSSVRRVSERLACRSRRGRSGHRETYQLDEGE